jgi:hypothetical protein
MKMKKVFLLVLLLATILAPPMVMAKPASKCTTIQDGVLTYSATHYLALQPLTTGYDPYGYNYQAHLFNGYYPNVYLGGEGLPPYTGDTTTYLNDHPEAALKWYWYPDVRIEMKWNDAWLSNKDCGIDGVGGPPDGKLDRHYGFPTYTGSGAWETNHQMGVDNGVHWTYFVKIVAVPTDATLVSGVWYAADGTEIGPSIWGFAIVLEVQSGLGATYVSPAGPGFGKY